MRIYIIGTSGSGKSTLAKQLTQLLECPHFELDQYRFLPGWVKRPRDEFIKIVQEKISEENWIICGNEEPPLKEDLISASDKIIWLDYSFPLIFFRTFKRTMRRIFRKQPCCNGNYETFFQQFFTEKSIFWWIIKTYRSRRTEYTALEQDENTRHKLIHIHHPKEVSSLHLLLSNSGNGINP